jgi:parallel beta-helix repeat protein
MTDQSGIRYARYTQEDPVTYKWYHVVGVREGNSIKIYVNGIEGAVTGTLQSSLNYASGRSWNIGRLGTYGREYNGTIDEVAIWNRSLSSEEVAGLYNYTKQFYQANFTLNDLPDATYEWNCWAWDNTSSDDWGDSNWTVNVEGNAPPTITLNAPANQSVTANNYNLLNITVSDPNNDNTTVYIFAGNDTSDLNTKDGLVYYAENVTSGSDVTYNFTSRPVQSDDPNLVLLYHMDNRSEWGENSSQQGRVYDFSGEGNNGTLGNGTSYSVPTWNATGGKLAGAFKFDGSDIIEAGIIDFDYTISYAVWFRLNSLDSPGGRQLALGRYYDAYRLGLWNGQYLSGSVWNGTSGNAWLIDGAQVDTWYHLALTYNGSEANFYINGEQQTPKPTTGSLANTNSPWQVGANGNANNFFNGTIDEVAIWNRSLTAEGVLDLYRLGEGKYYWSANASDGTDTTWNGTNEFTAGSTGESATYTEFTGPDTTDFNNSADITNVSDATLHIAETSRLTWYNNVNASGADFDTNVDFGFAFVYVNSAGLNSTFNTSANITLYSLPWLEIPAIFEDGSPCLDCVVNFYSGGNLSFNVTHFSNYSAGENANLSIWDDTDSQTKYVNENITFYANYTNITSGESVNGTGVTCNISFSIVPQGPSEMTFNKTSLLYEYNRTFSSADQYNWNATCNNSQGYENLSVTDTVTVSEAATECNSCSDCNTKISSASSGDIIRLNTSITDVVGTCISLGGKDNITFDCDGYTISGNGSTSTGYGIWLNQSNGGSNNNTIMDCTNVSYFYYGIFLRSSDNNTLTNNMAYYNNVIGIYIRLSNYNNLTNNTAWENGDGSTWSKGGIYLKNSNYTILTNNNASYNNQTGIFIYRSHDNIINSSYILNNIDYTFYLEDSTSENNLIYDNYINHTSSGSGVYFYSAGVNNWNTTKTSGTNILGGSWLGGNYWTNVSGTGFSDTCEDWDGDGICDYPSSYDLGLSNYDYLPLTNVKPGNPCDSCSDCNTKISSASSGDIIRLNTSITDVVGTCISLGGKDNLTFDCDGFTISGDNTGGYDYGILANNSNGGSDNITIKNCANISYFFYGIVLWNSENSTIINSSIFDAQNNVFSYGISVSYSSNITVIDTNITNSGAALRLYYTENSTFENLNLSYNSWAVQVKASTSSNNCAHSFSNITAG